MQIHTWYTTAQQQQYIEGIWGKVLEIGPWRHQIWETHLERVGADFLFAQITVLYQLYPISRLTCLFAQWGGNAFFRKYFSYQDEPTISLR